ncbi:LppU/SCO3897 family protein [Streptomyces yangpuensis]|uniref:LppU/SCO3897 family protein n=1 Tax=Streptomyces yangpuensis TaxID=1648182 RepID=UPI00365CE8F0
MSSQEMLITITPQQAAHGVILPVELPTGTVRLRIPPCRHGDLVQVRVGTEEMRLRIHVSGAGAAWIAGAGGITPPPPADTVAQRSAPAPQTGGGRGCLVGLAVAAVLVIGFFLLSGGDDGDDAEPAAEATPTWSSSWSPSPTPEASATTPYSSEPSAAPSAEPSPEPSPFDRGTCLNGQLPDSTTPRSVSGVEEVPCSASDAHYRVIESIPGTADLNSCNDNPKTQYAFSYRYMRGSTVLNQYVYCLVGIGSYAR